MDTYAEGNKVGPNYFEYFTREVACLLSQTDNFLPIVSQTSDLVGRTSGVNTETNGTKLSCNGKVGNNSKAGSLFCDAIGAGVSDFQKERLNVLLRQGVILLSQEVDEMVDPVFAMRRIQRYKMKISNCPSATCEDNGEPPHKKQKVYSSLPSIRSSPVSCIHSEKSLCDDCGPKPKEGTEHLAIETQKTKLIRETKLRGKKFHAVKGLKSGLVSKSKSRKGEESLAIQGQETTSALASNIGDEDCEVSSDLQLLLKTDSETVAETLKRIYDELYETLGCKKQKLEELLDTVMSYYRLMTLAEKEQLQILIKKLPPRNLDRVVEIIQRSNPSTEHSPDTIFVDLEGLDNTTLWRLYCFVQAVESARKLTYLDRQQQIDE